MSLTDRARKRICGRRIDEEVVTAALRHGRVAYVCGACIHSVGRRAVNALGQRGIDLSRCEGVHVVCAPEGAILTVYRNHNFRGLKPRGRSSLHRGRARQ